MLPKVTLDVTVTSIIISRNTKYHLQYRRSVGRILFNAFVPEHMYRTVELVAKWPDLYRMSLSDCEQTASVAMRRRWNTRGRQYLVSFGFTWKFYTVKSRHFP